MTSTPKSKLQTLDPQPSTLNPQPSTLNPQPHRRCVIRGSDIVLDMIFPPKPKEVTSHSRLEETETLNTKL